MTYATVLISLLIFCQCFSESKVVNSPMSRPNIVLSRSQSYSLQAHSIHIPEKLGLAESRYIMQNSRPHRHSLSRETKTDRNSNNLELVCRLKIYIDVASINRTIEAQNFKNEDKIVFLIPFFIIYWHHRYPRNPMPLADVEELLDELGDEVTVYRLELKEFMAKLKDKERCLDITSWDQTNLEHTRTAETILNFYAMINGHEIPNLRSSNAGKTGRGLGSSEVRLWLEDFKRQSCRRQNSIPSTTSITIPATGAPIIIQ